MVVLLSRALALISFDSNQLASLFDLLGGYHGSGYRCDYPFSRCDAIVRLGW